MSIDPLLLSQLQAFVSVVLIDIVLAGDNAVVVGTAAAGLPPRQQRRVIALGVTLALVLRIAFALVAVQLLNVFGLVLAGGILLLWVAWKMWREMRHLSPAEEAAAGAVAEGTEAAVPAPPAGKSVVSAAVQVTVADVSMSLDNVLAVAGAAREHPVIMAFGLLLSVALMGVAAGFIARLIERHHWIAYVGIAIVLYVALEMIWEGGREVWGALHEAGMV